MGRGSCMGDSVSYIIPSWLQLSPKGKIMLWVIFFTDWIEEGQGSISRLQCRTQWSTLKFCGCDLNLKTFNNMQQVPWFLFSANRNYILFLNLLICQPHRHVSFWTTFILTASQWLQSILIIVKRAHKEGFLDCLNYDVSFHAILWGALPCCCCEVITQTTWRNTRAALYREKRGMT